MATDRKKMKIVIMDDHFLYLPLFYAKSKEFFGYIPKEYNVGITTSSGHTDESAYKMLMDTNSAKNSQIVFAVADPAIILSHPLNHDTAPAILGAIISNTAFWAVDRKSHVVIEPQDLASFKNIIAFHPGTTSHAIAQRIIKNASKSPSIVSVHPSQELIALQKRVNTVALSPDILAIDALLHEKEQFNIDLALGTTQEFQNVLMTTLISRQDVVDQHRPMIIGLLKALQSALVQVRAQDPDLLAFAAQRFSQAEDRIESALKRAADAHVFPLTIEVTRVTWMNSAKIYYESTTTEFGQDQQQKARSIFQHVVQPYLALSKEAVSDYYAQVTTPSKTEPQWSKFLRLSLVALLCFGVGMGIQHWSNWKAAIIFILCTMSAIAIEMWLKIRRASFNWLCHWFLCGAIQLVLIAWLSPAIREYIPLRNILPPAAILTLFLGELRVIQDELKKAEQRG